MAAYVVVQFEQKLPTKSRGATAATNMRRIKQVIARSGGSMLQDAGTSGASGSMTILVSDMDRANDLAAELRTFEGVETAYAKPGEELP